MVTINNSIGNQIGASNTGVTNTLTITNPSDTANSAAQNLITVGGVSAGDPYITYTVAAGSTFSTGIDNTDSDKWKVSESATLGTSDRIALTPGADGDLVITLEDHGQNIVGTGTAVAQAAANFHKLVIAQSIVGGALVCEINNNDNTDVTSHAQLNIYAGGAGGGDPSIYYDIPGATGWVTGIDNSDTDAFKIGTGAASNPSTATNVLRATTAGEITMPLQPAFCAYLAAGDANVTGDATSYTIGSGTAFTEVFDQNGDFNTNGTFTAPVSGRYLFSASVQTGGVAAGHTFGFTSLQTSNQLFLSNTMNYAAIRTVATSADSVGVNISAIANMDAADTCRFLLRIDGGALAVDLLGSADGNTYFSGKLEC